jgi:amino acid permease
MEFNKSYIMIVAFFGILLLYSYYYFLKDNDNASKLWGRIKGNLLKIYYLSMLLATIGFILFFYYLLKGKDFLKEDICKIFMYTLGIVIISIFWTPFALEYYKTKKDIYKYLTILVLFLVALFSLLLVVTLYNVNEKDNLLNKKMALAGMIYFLIHTGLFDLILWSFHFF